MSELSLVNEQLCQEKRIVFWIPTNRIGVVVPFGAFLRGLALKTIFFLAIPHA